MTEPSKGIDALYHTNVCVYFTITARPRDTGGTGMKEYRSVLIASLYTIRKSVPSRTLNRRRALRLCHVVHTVVLPERAERKTRVVRHPHTQAQQVHV
jgi:hypothetical protein